MFVVAVASQVYTVNLMEENVLRGNSAIVKCHIPSFVTEYVSVTSWIMSEPNIDDIEIKCSETSDLGTSAVRVCSPSSHALLVSGCSSGDSVVHSQPVGGERIARQRSHSQMPNIELCQRIRERVLLDRIFGE